MRFMEDLFVFAIGFVFGGIVSMLITIVQNDKSWQAELVNRGFAEYSQTTGKWQWKEGDER